MARRRDTFVGGAFTMLITATEYYRAVVPRERPHFVSCLYNRASWVRISRKCSHRVPLRVLVVMWLAVPPRVLGNSARAPVSPHHRRRSVARTSPRSRSRRVDRFLIGRRGVPAGCVPTPLLRHPKSDGFGDAVLVSTTALTPPPRPGRSLTTRRRVAGGSRPSSRAAASCHAPQCSPGVAVSRTSAASPPATWRLIT